MLDFVICLGNRVLAAVEVDGAYHREDESQFSFDERKDEIMSRHSGIGYIRVATNGSENGDILTSIDEEIGKALSHNEYLKELSAAEMASLRKI